MIIISSKTCKKLYLILTISLLSFLPNSFAVSKTPPPSNAEHSLTHSKQTPITPFKVSYTLKKGGIPVAEVTRELKKSTTGTYLFQSESKPIGVATFFIKDVILERSIWQPVEGNFRPEEYSYERTGGKKDRHVKLIFNWETNKVTNIINNDAWHMNIPGNVQDKLLYQLSIMYDLDKQDKKLNYEVADGGRLKDYSFEVLSNETIPTKVGQIETIKIRRQVKNRTITIWCAPKYNYLPVQIEQNDKDGEFELYINTITGF